MSIEILKSMQHAGYGALRTDYSGRFMYGARCAGLITDRPIDCIEEAASRGLRGAHMDAMGVHTIVYWPTVKTGGPK